MIFVESYFTSPLKIAKPISDKQYVNISKNIEMNKLKQQFWRDQRSMFNSSRAFLLNCKTKPHLTCHLKKMVGQGTVQEKHITS